MSWNHPDDVPTSLTRRAYCLRGVTLSQNQYAAVVADAYEDIAREVARELAQKIRNHQEPWEWALAGQHAGNDAANLIDPEVNESRPANSEEKTA
ncbi:hypothetical protein [Streptomyces sp. NPDC004376]